MIYAQKEFFIALFSFDYMNSSYEIKWYSYIYPSRLFHWPNANSVTLRDIYQIN